MNLSDLQKQNLVTIAEIIKTCFPWSRTPQHSPYWNDVFARLLRIADKPLSYLNHRVFTGTIDRDKIRYAADVLIDNHLAFTWSYSPEGQDYWNEVHNNLLALSRGEQIEIEPEVEFKE